MVRVARSPKDNMAGIKSVKLNTGQRVEVGSKAYQKYTASGSTPVSGTGTNLTPKDIKGIGGGFQTESVGERYKRIRPELGGSPGTPAPTFGQPIDTSQPSPTTAVKQATAGPPGSTVEFDATTGAKLAPGSTTIQGGQTLTQGSKYQQALPQLQATGQAPQDAGVGKMKAGAVIQPTAVEPVSPLGGLMEVDTNFDSIFTNLDKYMEPLQQKKSLLQEYQSMSKALGIEDINEELIDAKRIIEGTEDDIRAEVTAAGGFATDSQVLALANARNKSLIKNYNVLLESRDNAMQQLNTMMNLTMEDRRAAEAEFDRKLGFAFKIQEFQQRAQDNARSQLNSIVNAVGYGGLLAATNGNPYEQSLVEKTLGLGVGGLFNLATYKKPLTEEEQLDLELKRSELLTDKAQRAKIYADITKVDTGKPISSSTALQLADSQAATQMLSSLETVLNNNTNLFGPLKGRLGALNPYATQSQNVQSSINATKQIVGKFLEGGVLRKEDEVKYEKILPTLKDTPAVAKAKLANVKNLVNAKIKAQQETLQSSGYNVNLSPSDANIIIGPDGQEYEITN